MKNQDERIAEMKFSSVYPHYLNKVVKKGRTQIELDQVICWLTGFNQKKLMLMIEKQVTFEEFFHNASLNIDAKYITGVICGHRVEDIKNKLTQKVRYMDKIVDELAKGKSLEKIYNRKK
jgi:hypothetical protein